MKTKFYLILPILYNCFFLSNAQQNDFSNITLSNYCINSNPEELLIGHFVGLNNEHSIKLIGESHRFFETKQGQFFLSKKGRKYFKKSTQATVDVRVMKKNAAAINSSFTILKNEFLQNKVIAHRGAWKNTNAPQNSIASLQAAIKLGVAGSEFDIHLTADDVLVINHDPAFEGMTIEKTNYTDLQKHSLKNGEPIPTLENYLKTGMLQQKTKLIAELKPSIISKERSLKLAEKVVALVDKLQAQAWVVYISFSYDILKKIVELEPSAQTQYLNGGATSEQLKADGITGADYHFSVYQRDEQWITNAHQNGRVVNGWTINDPLMMEYFLVRNIDLITTDEPEKLLEIITKQGNKKFELQWSDEFNGIGLPDSTKWSYDEGGHGWGNNELQYYTKADTLNVKVAKGLLQITVRKQNKSSNAYTSARLVTNGKSNFKYGKIEIRAKLPKGRGLWPAIWMLGTNLKKAGWPTCGEIDIMEHVGFNPDSIFGTVHTKSYNHMLGTQKGKSIFTENVYDQFHIYSVEWSPQKIDFMVDGIVFNTIPNEHKTIAEWPFDEPFYLLLNVAVGGAWGGQKGIDETVFPATMEIDYVRVFKN